MSEVLLEQPGDGVALLRINRSERMNALSMTVREDIARHVEAMAADAACRCIVLTGDDKAFAAGADVAEFVERTPLDAAFARSRAAWDAMEKCPKPMIAALSGFALGGGFELAMHCDIIIAGVGARIGQPEVRLGIMPGAGGTQRFLRAAGKFAVMRWVLTGDQFSAADALRMGLVSEVVADADVLTHSLAIAARIALLPPLAVTAIKETILLGGDAPLTAALALERKAFQLLFASRDRDEGIAAFLERRKPHFTGQ